MTFTPGKLYRLKNCGWFVFKCNGKLVALDENQKPIVMFVKEEEMEGLERNQPLADCPLSLLTRASGDIV